MPDRPAARAEARLGVEAAKPERAFEGCTDSITPVEVAGEIENGVLAVAPLHYSQEVAELLVEFRP